MANLAPINFLEALCFPILDTKAVALSHIETAKPRGSNSLAPSLTGAKKYFLQSVSSTICVLYNTMKSPMGRELYLFLIGKLWKQD